MGEQELLHAAIHEKVALHGYDARWPDLFEAERRRLLAVLPGTFVAIEHIGSTAVPGLIAKPIIDLLAATLGSRARTPVCRAEIPTGPDPPGRSGSLHGRQGRLRAARSFTVGSHTGLK